jgi:hypothetical protein
VPTTDRSKGIDDPESKLQVDTLAENCAEFGVEYFDEMDIDKFDVILEKYNEMRFTVDNTKEFKCECGHKQIFEFDEIPGFFPDSWIK